MSRRIINDSMDEHNSRIYAGAFALCMYTRNVKITLVFEHCEKFAPFHFAFCINAYALRKFIRKFAFSSFPPNYYNAVITFATARCKKMGQLYFYNSESFKFLICILLYFATRQKTRSIIFNTHLFQIRDVIAYLLRLLGLTDSQTQYSVMYKFSKFCTHNITARF